jgi:hypothetical protein
MCDLDPSFYNLPPVGNLKNCQLTGLFGGNLGEDIGTVLNSIAWSEFTVLLPFRLDVSTDICIALSIVF